MAHISKSILINAPVEKVFAYFDQPLNTLEYWPSMVDIRDVKRLSNGGAHFHWTYKMAGMRFDGTCEDVEHEVNQRVVSLSKGGINSKLVWTFQPEGEGTRVTCENEYTVPMPVLGKLAENFILKTNEREAETVLANLKDRVEALEPVK